MILDFENLFAPYSEGGTHPFSEKERWLRRKAQELDISTAILDSVIMEIFIDLSKGRQFDVNHCPCNCGIDKPGTAITHAILARAIAVDSTLRREATNKLQEEINTKIISYIEEQNAKYIMENAPKPFFERVKNVLFNPER
jgi:hypothetical protein